MGKVLVSAILVLMIVMSACSSTRVEERQERSIVQPNVASSSGQAPLPDTSDPNWANQTITATGEAAIAYDKYPGRPGQAKLMAKRAAQVVAYRKLLEQILGLKVSSQTYVKDMVGESDEIKAQVDGYIRQAREVGYHPGADTVQIQMALKLYNVFTYLRTKRTYYK